MDERTSIIVVRGGAEAITSHLGKNPSKGGRPAKDKRLIIVIMIVWEFLEFVIEKFVVMSFVWMLKFEVIVMVIIE